MENYVILVNTTDTFEDCWEPFFKLFAFYWPDYNGKIYLNTESKEFTYPGLDIMPIKNGLKKLSENTWSKCLLAALNSIAEETVLYMQEDYFLKEKVRSEIVNHYADVLSNNDIDCIHFTYQSTPGPFHKSEFEDLWKINRKAPFRVSCQAALWKKSVLMQYIRKHESPWHFEFYGSLRARFFGHKFFTVNRDIYGLNENTIINYVFTGVIKGRWRKDVVDLFKEHDIIVDYKTRGIFSYDEKPGMIRLIKRKLNSIPSAIRSRIEILNLRDA